MSPGAGTSLFLVDASPYIFRAYFSLPSSIQTPDGQPANAVRGFATFLLQLLARPDVTHVAAAFDRSLTTSFRNEWYPEYKAQRELPDEELVAQLSWCQEVAEGLGIPTFASETYEADDLVGSLAHRYGRKAERVVVVSPDKDLAQLVDARTVLFDFAKDRWLDAGGVEEHFGVRPDQVVDLLALQGDAVDNIPGVPGVGKKTAVALLQALDGFDAIYRRLDEVPDLPIRGAARLKQRLEEHRDLAELSRRLATIVTDAPLDTDWRRLRYQGAREETLLPLLETLGFGRIRDRVPRWKTTGRGA